MTRTKACAGASGGAQDQVALVVATAGLTMTSSSGSAPNSEA